MSPSGSDRMMHATYATELSLRRPSEYTCVCGASITGVAESIALIRTHSQSSFGSEGVRVKAFYHS